MGVSSTVPLLLRAARGEKVDRPPVWMMRQAGRYMKAYRDLREKYPSFRERSEIPEVAIEVSLQPWRAFQPDGVILFSDIVTPLPGMGIDMDIAEGKGPIIFSPIRTQKQVDELHPLDPETALPFIRQILGALRQEVGSASTVLGFVGAPWTLAAYAVEGKGSKTYSIIKNMAFSDSNILHQLLDRLAESIAVYIRYQIDCGAQVVQMFDSWAGQLSPQDYDIFALPYQKKVFELVKRTHPQTPLILLVTGSAGLLERMATSGADILTIDWTVDMADARRRLGNNVKVQGNLDPGVLFGSKQFIRERILDTVRKAGNWGHILNLGHGVLPETPEENVAFFFETAKNLHVSV
ncbi:uroporphyrinogen decarboxylase [Cylindrospermopsis raciborskii]|uniref:Uroporphyrinogen decarboxylase n=1 Tax=Cylindrospermopsis raciborskii CENA302 TaxID=1170768 RepID=A0A9Q5W8M8_9CYAN|nr:uroporphyrinogen decarboxylase [Cylindrospermopsis raciborskii]MCZ2200321.1 uroporphyrinogen decarboxylase [Cylindrospermopsis raciborskii PAMP2012]MCZ2206822.1 uroporphyrinogen decarboxylase [Cylindrospermopsis raciborskii PAMP2011]NLQ06217.1 uroporphyrinogen decarboxylase [Cylindrospermopsis raciborskii MVCC19]OHY35538.1 uroporphyrinogen decarboxylase [Cylindrospermopsis raciborskii MVCC14]OPH09329.1 uroporphyrinogen decarboxylase [Cylindrospermopsis raciborskii CENA302]